MTSNSLSAAVLNRLVLIEQSADRIQEGGGAAALHELRMRLLDLLEHIQRNPGIEAASQDLYDAAAAHVDDTSGNAVRHARLLKEARLRLRQRLAEAREP